MGLYDHDGIESYDDNGFEYAIIGSREVKNAPVPGSGQNGLD